MEAFGRLRLVNPHRIIEMFFFGGGLSHPSRIIEIISGGGGATVTATRQLVQGDCYSDCYKATATG